MLAGLLGFGLHNLGHRIRRESAPPERLSAHRLVLGTAWVALAFWAGFLGLAAWTGVEHPLVLAVGLPVAAHAILGLPIAGLAFAAAAGVRLWNEWDGVTPALWLADVVRWASAVLLLLLRSRFAL